MLGKDQPSKLGKVIALDKDGNPYPPKKAAPKKKAASKKKDE